MEDGQNATFTTQLAPDALGVPQVNQFNGLSLMILLFSFPFLRLWLQQILERSKGFFALLFRL